MAVKITYKNRRCGTERRKAFTPHDGAERRSGDDRRKLEEKLKNLIQKSIVEQEKEKSFQTVRSSGGIIRRRKEEKEDPPAS